MRTLQLLLLAAVGAVALGGTSVLADSNRHGGRGHWYSYGPSHRHHPDAYRSYYYGDRYPGYYGHSRYYYRGGDWGRRYYYGDTDRYYGYGRGYYRGGDWDRHYYHQDKDRYYGHGRGYYRGGHQDRYDYYGHHQSRGHHRHHR